MIRTELQCLAVLCVVSGALFACSSAGDGPGADPTLGAAANDPGATSPPAATSAAVPSGSGVVDGGARDAGSSPRDGGLQDSGPHSNNPPDAGPPTPAPTPDAGSKSCVYPAGPYGVTKGSVVAPTLSWQVYPAGSTPPVTVSASDYFDCDGKKGINALDISQAATWCGACQQEATALDKNLAGTWRTLGVHVLTLMIEDGQQNPATVSTAKQWIQSLGLKQTDVGADPKFTFQPRASVVSLPMNIVVDPRTMTITAILNGYSPSDRTVEDLARKNAPR